MRGDGSAVLVVDDDRVNCALLSRLLENEGYRPKTAANGREALAALEQEPFDAVLLDLLMPEVDGLEVLRSVKADARLWHIPVIMISGVEDTESIVSCLELGADDYVQKPFDPVLLRARLNACLARRQFQNLEVEYQKMVRQQADELDNLRREATGNGTATGDRAQDSHAWRANVAVLGVGLGGLNEFAGEADPAAAVAVADAFHTTVGGLANGFDGAVTARSGDTLTVVFGGAQPSTDPAAAALRMAVALEEQMTALAAGWKTDGRPILTWGAGLAVGDAVVGLVTADNGAPHLAAAGPVVDRAARLRDLALGGVVLLDEGAAAVRPDGQDADRWEQEGDPANPVYLLRPRTRWGAPPGPARGDSG